MSMDITYSEYLFLKHRYILVLRRVFPNAEVRINHEQGYGVRVTLTVGINGKLSRYTNVLSIPQVRTPEYAKRVLDNMTVNMVRYLLEDSWARG